MLKQFVKITNQAKQSDNGEQRDGSVVFIGKRRSTVERVRHSRGASQDVGEIAQNKARVSEEGIKIKQK